MPHPSSKRRYQRALYWPRLGTVNGEPLLDYPQELRVRWEWTRREIRAADSSTIALDAQVWANQTLAQGSYLWLAPEVDNSALAQWHGAGIEPGWDLVEVLTTTRTPDLRNRSSGYTANCQRARDYVPGGWGILRIPGLELWLHADYNLYSTSVGVAEPDDNEPVGRWVSLDVLFREFTQSSSGARPVVKNKQINGKRTVRFDGVDDALSTNVDLLFTSGFTVYAVVSEAISKNISAYFNDGRLSIDSTLQIEYVDQYTNMAAAAYSGATGPVIIRFRMGETDNACKFAATGMQETDLAGIVCPFVYLGQLGTDNSGDWRHLLVFNRNLTVAERSLVEDYLKQDTGLELP